MYLIKTFLQMKIKWLSVFLAPILILQLCQTYRCQVNKGISIVLTFDTEVSPRNVEEIIDILNKHKTRVNLSFICF